VRPADEDERQMSPELTHFLRLASSGAGCGASSGQRAATKLADTLCDLVPRLDGKAIDGLMEFVRIAKDYPSSACDLY